MLARFHSIRLRIAKQSIFIFAASISLFLSYDGYLRGHVVNPDGVCYLQSAESLATLSLTHAMHLCGQAKWPFYSILIYALQSVTHLSYLASAFFLNSFFSLISVLTFIYLTSLLTPSKRILWFAAAVILLAHEFNDVRAYVIRDHGFWAFYLLSMVFLIKHFQILKWQHALYWSLSILMATLFRIEGGVFLMFIPISAFLYFSSLKQKIKSFLQLNIVSIFLLVIFSSLILFSAQGISHLTRVNELGFQLVHAVNDLIASFNRSSQALANNVLSVYSKRDANSILLLMLIVWYLKSVISNVSMIYAALIIYAWIKKIYFTQQVRIVVWSYIFINIIITSIFLIENMFISKRYLMALSLALMVWVPFALDKLCELKYKKLLALSALLIVITALGGIFDFGYSKSYVLEAGQWLAQHAPQQAKIYSNDSKVMYYSQHFGNEIFNIQDRYLQENILQDQKWRAYDFIALHIQAKQKAENAKIFQALGFAPAIIYSNARGDQVVIYKIK